MGQKWREVSTWRLRPRVEVIRGGGAAGTVTRGAGGACSHAAQRGLWGRPANDFGSLERGRRGRRGSAGLCGVAEHGLGQAICNMKHTGRKMGVESWRVPPFTWRDPGGIVPGFRGKRISRRLEVHHHTHVEDTTMAGKPYRSPYSQKIQTHCSTNSYASAMSFVSA